MSVKNTARHFSEDHDHVFVFAKNLEAFTVNQIPAGEKQLKSYKNPDNDPRGAWQSISFSARNFYSKGTYPITTPKGRYIEGPPPSSYWRVSEVNFWKLDADDRIWWGKDGKGIPRRKMFLKEQGELTKVPQTIWPFDMAGHTQDAKKEVLSLNQTDAFSTPKPEKLLSRIIQISTKPDDVVLDSFLGVASRTVVWLSLEKFRFQFVPVFHGLQGRLAA